MRLSLVGFKIIARHFYKIFEYHFRPNTESLDLIHIRHYNASLCRQLLFSACCKKLSATGGGQQ